MYFNQAKQGFTLIELLVVVLIIGILAAVALPQYQQAVMKARVTEAVVTMKAIMDAEEVYHLANGEYTNDLSLLDIEVKTESPYYRYTFKYAWPKIMGYPPIEFFSQHKSNSTEQDEWLGKRWCNVNLLEDLPEVTNQWRDTATRICKSMGTLDPQVANGHYIIQ